MTASPGTARTPAPGGNTTDRQALTGTRPADVDRTAEAEHLAGDFAAARQWHQMPCGATAYTHAVGSRILVTVTARDGSVREYFADVRPVPAGGV